MKPIVVQSINDATENRCIDILRSADGFAYVECRRDPEDGHGWRRLGVPVGAFDTADAALAQAKTTIGWIEDAT